MDPNASPVDQPQDFGTGEAAKVSRWISELDLSDKDQTKWITRGRKIVKRYTEADQTGSRFSLLWSNIQTLAPAVYARTPTAVVGRRWKDGDPVARAASEVIERALNFSLDAMDFAQIMTSLRDEFLIVGRGQSWVRYAPHVVSEAVRQTDPATGEITDSDETYDRVVWEEVVADHVHWEDWGTNVARTWAEVRMVWRRAYMTRDELTKRFGEKGKTCPLDAKEKSQDGKDDQFAKAAVYEIWDKPTKTVFWICRAFTSAPLDERPDPLDLKEFFPCPRPLLATTGPDSIIPTPDYVYYESQAKEIDTLTRRIVTLIEALKVRGFYAASADMKLSDLFTSDNNTLIPVESWAALAGKGGVKGLIEWFPVDMVADVLKSCIDTRKQMLDDVFQITGIADIMRGDTDPNETAAAQQLKSNWGSSRVRDKQKDLARFVRDLLVIMGEVVSNKFSTDTLSRMTGVDMFASPEQKQQVAQMTAIRAQAAQSTGQPPPSTDPTQARMMEDPTWQEVEGLLHDDAMRSFRIDIETDSTVEPNDQQDKQRRVEFIEAVGQYLEKTLTVVQLAPQMLPVVIEGLKYLVRGFRVGREMEDVIDMALDKMQEQADQPPPPTPPDPAAAAKAQADQMHGQAAIMKAQADQQNVQVQAQRIASQHQIGMGQVQAENARTDADRAAEVHMHNEGLKADLQQTVVKAIQQHLKRDINSDKPLGAPT